MTIHGQLLEFQKLIRSVSKDSKGYGYTYASLDNIVETIAPALEKAGIGYIHTFSGDTIICTIFNKEGESITSELSLVIDNAGKMSASQQQGSAITYARRYTLSAILGLVTDEDTDGATMTPKTSQNAPKRQNIKPKSVVNTGDETYLKIIDAFDKFSDFEALEKQVKAKYSIEDETLVSLQTLYNIYNSGIIE